MMTTHGAPGSEDHVDARRASTPTPADLTDGTVRLLAEVDAILSSDRWAILDNPTEHVKWLLYDAASLRHCCKLLGEIEVAAQSGQELTVRILGRTHLEAWLTALYLHFGEYKALTRIAQDTRDQLEKTNQEIQRFDTWLTGEKKSVRKRISKVKKVNKWISCWNVANPHMSPKPIHEEPYSPRLSKTGLDLSDRIANFDPCQAQSLSVSELVDALTKLATEKGYGRESFRPIYLIYRFLSMSAAHPTLHMYDSYLIPPITPGGFIRLAPTPLDLSQIDVTWVTALYGTAYLASYILGDAGCKTPVADELKTHLQLDPSGEAAWFSGV